MRRLTDSLLCCFKVASASSLLSLRELSIYKSIFRACLAGFRQLASGKPEAGPLSSSGKMCRLL